MKYDATAEQDGIIIDRVAQLADKHGVFMTEFSLAWLLTKVTAYPDTDLPVQRLRIWLGAVSIDSQAD